MRGSGEESKSNPKMSCLGDMEKDWDDKSPRVRRKKKKHWQRECYWKREVFYTQIWERRGASEMTKGVLFDGTHMN